TNPGFVVRITQAGLDYANQQGIAILEKELAQLKLPDISGDSRVLHVGKVHYELSSPRGSEDHPVPSIIPCAADPVLGAGRYVPLSLLAQGEKGNRGHSTWGMGGLYVYIKITLRLGSDTTGKPTISTSDCNARISKVRLLLSGKFGWLYNLFHSVIESKLRKSLESKLCDNVARSVQNELQRHIQTLPVTARIDDKTGIDYSLVAPPRTTAQSLDLDLKLEEMYPNMTMKFRLSAPTAPFLTIGPGGISFQPTVDAQAYAILPNSSLAPLFLLSLVRNVSAVINVRSGRIVGSVDVGRIRLSLKDSAVGTFKVRMMQSLMNILTSSTLLPRLN
ncbi:BPI protein, partial [Sylvia borin]|nr:BPI protein [Sylvia borin]